MFKLNSIIYSNFPLYRNGILKSSSSQSLIIDFKFNDKSNFRSNTSENCIQLTKCIYPVPVKKSYQLKFILLSTQGIMIFAQHSKQQYR